MEHTPKHSLLPWHMGSSNDKDYMGELPRGSYYIAGADGEVVAEINSCGVKLPRHKQDAAHIVKAANHHEELVEALETAIKQLEAIGVMRDSVEPFKTILQRIEGR